ncbi:MAG: Rieske (2Fe-2S) protein [Candidatus Hydrogenedentes bacterium]|nr:Rieske (2Fe-2S) protein [Candidatus Hydrogenedentota bacterium]
MKKDSNKVKPEKADGPGGATMGRRGFVKAGIGAMSVCYVGAVAYPVYRYLAAPAKRAEETAKISQIALPMDKLPPAGTALTFMFGSRPALLIHLADGTKVCLDAVCTHLGCTVKFETDLQRIHCACHGGVYDARTGKNVSGPPPKPLKPYKVEFANGQINISRA